MRDMTFQYGGKHFMPIRKFEQKDGDFYQITRRLRLDVESQEGTFPAACSVTCLSIEKKK